jgi:hypothetical protein
MLGRSKNSARTGFPLTKALPPKRGRLASNVTAAARTRRAEDAVGQPGAGVLLHHQRRDAAQRRQRHHRPEL